MSTVTLCILRHLESEHNVAEKLGENTNQPRYFDPDLTAKGQQDLKTFREGTDFEVWVSPLKRTLRTAVLALPQYSKFRVVENLREISGFKAADSRRDRDVIEKWCAALWPLLQFDFSGMPNLMDPWACCPYRETPALMSLRVEELLWRIIEAADTRGQLKFVWVSHSAFLSCLLALLQLPKGNPEARWLRNGEWRTLVLPLDRLRDLLLAYRHARHLFLESSETGLVAPFIPLTLRRGPGVRREVLFGRGMRELDEEAPNVGAYEWVGDDWGLAGGVRHAVFTAYPLDFATKMDRQTAMKLYEQVRSTAPVSGREHVFGDEGGAVVATEAFTRLRWLEARAQIHVTQLGVHVGGDVIVITRFGEEGLHEHLARLVPALMPLSLTVIKHRAPVSM